MTEDVGDVVASVPEQVLPAVLDGTTDAIVELPAGEAAGPAVELVDDTVESLSPVSDDTEVVEIVESITEDATTTAGDAVEDVAAQVEDATTTAGDAVERRRRHRRVEHERATTTADDAVEDVAEQAEDGRGARSWTTWSRRPRTTRARRSRTARR